jgi:hypothetical protein
MIIAPLMGGAFMDFVGIDAVFYVGGAISLIGTGIFLVMMQRGACRDVAGETPEPG